MLKTQFRRMKKESRKTELLTKPTVDSPLPIGSVTDELRPEVCEMASYLVSPTGCDFRFDGRKTSVAIEGAKLALGRLSSRSLVVGEGAITRKGSGAFSPANSEVELIGGTVAQLIVKEPR